MESSQPVALFRAPFSEDSRNSHALLYQAATRYSGLTADELGPLVSGPWGKPAFSGTPSLHASLSHSGSWWICALSPRSVGLDLQIHRADAPLATLSRRFFHPIEDVYLAGQDYRPFFDLWCAKESYVKFTGQGFHLDPAEFSVVSPKGIFPRYPGVQLRLLPADPGYSLCLCTACPAEVQWSEL